MHEQATAQRLQHKDQEERHRYPIPLFFLAPWARSIGFPHRCVSYGPSDEEGWRI